MPCVCSYIGLRRKWNARTPVRVIHRTEAFIIDKPPDFTKHTWRVGGTRITESLHDSVNPTLGLFTLPHLGKISKQRTRTHISSRTQVTEQTHLNSCVKAHTPHSVSYITLRARAGNMVFLERKAGSGYSLLINRNKGVPHEF